MNNSGEGSGLSTSTLKLFAVQSDVEEIFVLGTVLQGD